MISSEAAPFAKTGGLADVLGALPPELNAIGDECAVVLPRYGAIDVSSGEKVYSGLRVYLGGGHYECDIYKKVFRGTQFFFVDHPGLYGRDGFYGDRYGDFGDNHIRFALLCSAALGVARYLFPTQIFHCHDWQAGLLPLFLKNFVTGDPAFYNARTVFTIHNLGYQGLMPRARLCLRLETRRCRRAHLPGRRRHPPGRIEQHTLCRRQQEGLPRPHHLTARRPGSLHRRAVQRAALRPW